MRRRCDRRLQRVVVKRREGGLMWVVYLEEFEKQGEYNTCGSANTPPC